MGCCVRLLAVALCNLHQALLEGISLSQPQPKIPPELIKFLGKSFNAWHIAIPLLESHVIIFPDETRCFDALAELYKLVRLYHLCAGPHQSSMALTGCALLRYRWSNFAGEGAGAWVNPHCHEGRPGQVFKQHFT
jgi:hypothetical protein